MEEDIGSGDASSGALCSKGIRTRAVILAKQQGIVAGLPVAQLTFRTLDPNLAWNAKKRDGEKVACGETVVELAGELPALLAGERTALNFLQRMSGIATLTAQFVAAVAGFPAKILDTRKTAPGLRILDKQAVKAGGGFNHRFGLYDGVLLKDNYLPAAGGIRRAVSSLRRGASPALQIEVEVTNLTEAEEALNAGADIIMFDNMPMAEIAEAVRRIGRRALTEASGGITLENVRQVASTGVDRISVGALTHSSKALDLSLKVVQP